MKSGGSLNEFSGIFCDWLSIWQVHPVHAPLNRGSVCTFDGGGSLVFERIRASSLRGSHSTSINIKSDGRSVVASGNFGRFNRADNLFNFNPSETLSRANAITSFLGLPLFSSENIGEFPDRSDAVCVDKSALSIDRSSGFEVNLSRVDLTQNYECGSVNSARAVIRAISAKNISRVKKGVAGDSSVWWSNTRYMLKVYVKSLEMEAHGTNSGRAYEFAKERGIVRVELELKRRELHDLGWNIFSRFVQAWDNFAVQRLFNNYAIGLIQMTAINDNTAFIDSLPQRLRVIAQAHLAGCDVRDNFSRSAFYRYRRALLDYGLDIADERPARLDIKIRQIEITPVVAPDWYWEEQKQVAA